MDRLARIRRYVERLCAREIEGRSSGSAAARAVVAEIELRMRAVGLRGGAPDGTYRQSISGSGGCNVLGRLEGTGASDRAILVSAHHDHLGLDAGGTPFPGADDNARQYQKAKWTVTDCRAGLPPWASCARTP